MNTPQKKPQKRRIDPHALERSAERPRHTSDNKVEQAIINFTKIPEYLIQAVLSSLVEGTVSKPDNYTDLNHPDVKQKMENSYDQQDNKEPTIAELRRQLSLMREDESAAVHYFEKKDQEKKQEEAEEEREKARKEQQEHQQQAPAPTSKQKRGVMGQKRKKTVETSAAFGKQ